MKHTVYLSFLIVTMVVSLVSGSISAQDTVPSILDSKILTKSYNSVVVDFLVEEGKGKLPEKQRKEALDQLVTALKAKTQITKDKQLETALGTLTGIAMGMSGNDVISGAGQDVEGSYAAEWASWVDAAFKLLHAGYKQDAANFFKYGMETIPYPSLKARCVEGLAMAKPDEAYQIVMDGVINSNVDVKNAALRSMGYLVKSGGLSKEQKDTVMEKLIENVGGMKSNDTFKAAIYGLTVAGDDRAVEALSRFKKGFGKDEYVRRAALRSLLLTFNDQSVVEILQKMCKGGTFSTNDKYDQLFAGSTLIEAGDDAGYEWAKQELEKTKKGFFSSKNEPDIKPNVVNVLVNYGDERAAKALSEVIDKYKDKDWLKTWIAVGMLELGDDSAIELARKSLHNPKWDFTAVRITTALAKYGDFSGIPVLAELAENDFSKKSEAAKFFSALAGETNDIKSKEQRLARVRIQMAHALSTLNRAECVPILIKLLSDKDQYVRSAAAYGLTDMTNEAALEGLNKAITVDYGLNDKKSRNPVIYAHIVRWTAKHFPKESATKMVMDTAKKSDYADVRFLALIAL